MRINFFAGKHIKIDSVYQARGGFVKKGLKKKYFDGGVQNRFLKKKIFFSYGNRL